MLCKRDYISKGPLGSEFYNKCKIFIVTWNTLDSGFYDSRLYYFLEIELKWLS